jgi:hypothetical protein
MRPAVALADQYYVSGQRYREKICKVEIRILANEYRVIAAFSRT